MWTACRAVIEELPSTNATLSQFEDVVTAGLTSRHRSILNYATIFWNTTFGTAEHLEYTEKLRKALSRLRRVTELQLPDFSYEDDTEVS